MYLSRALLKYSPRRCTVLTGDTHRLKLHHGDVSRYVLDGNADVMLWSVSPFDERAVHMFLMNSDSLLTTSMSFIDPDLSVASVVVPSLSSKTMMTCLHLLR
jgi:hypothetical protein